MWEDPREIHQVVVHFKGSAPAPETVRLEYWGSRWPEQHLPKDREPGGGSVGWMELGNWYTYRWRTADAEAKADGKAITFTFRPVNAKEFPKLNGLPRRISIHAQAPRRVRGSAAEHRTHRGVHGFDPGAARRQPGLEIGRGRQGQLRGIQRPLSTGSDRLSSRSSELTVAVATNPDPNTFDRTLVTVRNGQAVFTFAMDDLKQGALFIPHAGAAVLPEGDKRDYAAVAAAQKAAGAKTLYDRVAEMPEQTWRGAWEGMPPKKSHIYLPLGLDCGRQRFRLDADGTVRFRSNDHYLRRRPGKETPRFALEPSPVRFRFQPPLVPVFRTIEEASLPIGHTVWETNGVRILQTAFATELGGARAEGEVPAPDTFAVFLAKFIFTNLTASPADCHACR